MAGLAFAKVTGNVQTGNALVSPNPPFDSKPQQQIVIETSRQCQTAITNCSCNTLHSMKHHKAKFKLLFPFREGAGHHPLAMKPDFRHLHTITDMRNVPINFAG